MFESPLFASSNEILFKKDGSRRPHEDAIQHFGLRSVWVAELWEALQRLSREPQPLSVPRRVFISYRRGSGDDEWVDKLALELERRNNIIVYDRRAEKEYSPPAVPELVARMYECHVFLAVIDSGYVKRIGVDDNKMHGRGLVAERTTFWSNKTGEVLGGYVHAMKRGSGPIANLQANRPAVDLSEAEILDYALHRAQFQDIGDVDDGWVWDEYQVALALAYAGKLLPVGFLRSGDDLPQGFRLAQPGKSGNTFDVRTSKGLDAALDFYFSQRVEPPERGIAAVASRMIRESEEFGHRRDYANAYVRAEKAATLIPNLVDGHMQVARMAAQVDKFERAYSAALSGAEIDPTRMELLVIRALSAYRLGRHREAVNVGVTVLKGEHRDARSHSIIGNALGELGQVYAGIAHLEIASFQQPENDIVRADLGVTYRYAGQYEKAVTCFDHLLKLKPNDTEVLVNLIAALIENGSGPRARKVIDKFKKVQPDHPSIKFLDDRLGRWLAEGGQPPVLIRRVRQRKNICTISCDGCKSSIPVFGLDQRLCTACGAELFESLNDCQYCGGRNVAQVSCSDEDLPPCPYCRVGRLNVRHDQIETD